MAAVIITVCKLFGLGKDKEDEKEKKKKDKSVQIVDEDTQNSNDESVQVNQQEVNLEIVKKSNAQENVYSPKQTYPKYYAVKQNKNYVMAEYQDRYELYLKTPNGLSKIRTDYK